MINSAMHLVSKLTDPEIEQEPIRAGFGKGLVEAGRAHAKVVALCADLTESTRMEDFAKAYPERFFEVGVAEQNLVTVASGMAAMGLIPFVSSYAAFSPGRNWEQIRTTICLNDVPVKIAGSHAGVSVGPDGATHQMLEDIALMRALPNMTVVVPADSVEAAKATQALAASKTPAYIRLAREKTPIITTAQSPFSLGKAQILRSGDHLTIVACGPMVYQALVAAESLETEGISAEVINCPVVKPLDGVTILASARRTGAVITVEEAQRIGGLGAAVAEVTAERQPVPVVRIGINDRFGESGAPAELIEHFGLSAPHIAKAARELVKRKS